MQKTKCIDCGLTIIGPKELNVQFCSTCEDKLVSYCGSCRSIIHLRKCKNCGFVSSPEGYYKRSIELQEECNRHEQRRY